MTIPMRKSHPIIKIMNSSLIDLPSPSNISYMWNMGSLLGLCLMIQLVTGVFLAMHFTADTNLSFASVTHIMWDVNFGWVLRILHANGASLFFICLYLHILRGMYYGSYRLLMTWSSGVLILFITMATAFLGYVLPWGQMSFWGATVITNLLSAIPYVGPTLVYWLWGGFSVQNATLTRFFALHFMLPFIISAMVAIHLLFLHQTGSNNPTGMNSNLDKSPFHPYFSTKDLLGYITTLALFSTLILYKPFLLGDPENFNPANPMATPIHIQPEWYFLFAYAILRSIPNKLGGVIALIMSIMILMTLPMINKFKFQSSSFSPLNKILFWSFINISITLTWIGARPVEPPFESIGMLFTLLYFTYFLVTPLATK